MYTEMPQFGRRVMDGLELGGNISLNTIIEVIEKKIQTILEQGYSPNISMNQENIILKEISKNFSELKKNLDIISIHRIFQKKTNINLSQLSIELKIHKLLRVLIKILNLYNKKDAAEKILELKNNIDS